MRKIYLLALPVVMLTACSDEPKGNDGQGGDDIQPSTGFYLLNQGNMGTNDASIDYYDFATGELTLDFFTRQNPSVVLGLGDVGNDLAIYEGKMFAVINCSNKVEIMEATTCKRLGQVDIPNCRYIAFQGNYAYVTSYAGPVEFGQGAKQKGYVAKIDIPSMTETDRCEVGCQPDGIGISGGKIYVANSNGYTGQNEPGTVSVIDIATFKVEKELTMGINLNLVKVDSEGKVWISSRGNYADVESAIYCYDPASGSITCFPVANSMMTVCGDMLYAVGMNFDMSTFSYTRSYNEINTRDQIVSVNSWKGSKEFEEMVYPYGIAVDNENGDIYMTDANDFVTAGYLYCFDKEKKFKWRRRAGIIPCSIAFL